MKWRSTAAAFLLCFALAEPAVAQSLGGRLSNRATIDQRGAGNAAGVVQNGANNDAGVIQLGRNNIGTISQDGNNNQACLVQIGRNLDGAVVQTGDNNRVGVLQGRRGIREISPDACARARNSGVMGFMMGPRGR